MPLNHALQNSNHTYITHKEFFDHMLNTEINRVLYSSKRLSNGYEEKAYESLELSLCKYDPVFKEFYYLELCPLLLSNVELFAGKIFYSQSTINIESSRDRIFYYNKILERIEDFIKKSIEEFTDNAFTFIVEGV